MIISFVFNIKKLKIELKIKMKDFFSESWGQNQECSLYMAKYSTYFKTAYMTCSIYFCEGIALSFKILREYFKCFSIEYDFNYKFDRSHFFRLRKLPFVCY